MKIGDWAWKYHPQIFQYSKQYVRLSSSTPSRASTAEGDDDDDDEEEEEEEEEVDSIVEDDEGD
jgi:hypothetical protein